MKHNGDLIITSENAAECEKITEVTGWLGINAPATLPALQIVGGGLYIRAPATLPSLQSVGERLYIYAPVKIPALQTVGGWFYIYADTKLPALHSVGGCLVIRAPVNIPALQNVDTLIIGADATLPNLQSVNGWLEIHADATLPALTHIQGKRMLMSYVVDSRGYAGALVEDNLVAAGCHLFTSAQAREHWGKREDADAKFWLDKVKEWEGV